MVKPGSPLETWTSTETGRPTAPVSVADAMAACCTAVNGRPGPHAMPHMYRTRDNRRAVTPIRRKDLSGRALTYTDIGI